MTVGISVILSLSLNGRVSITLLMWKILGRLTISTPLFSNEMLTKIQNGGFITNVTSKLGDTLNSYLPEFEI